MTYNVGILGKLISILNILFSLPLWSISLLLIVGASLSVWQKKLTWTAAITGALLGFLIFLSAGFFGLAMLGTFFLVGSVATALNFGTKHKLGIAEGDKGQRKAGQVWANAGVAGLFSALTLIDPQNTHLFVVAMAGSFSSAIADTLSSELGAVYGTKFYNITTLQKDARGLNGVISIEGCLIGLGGSILIALIYALGYGFDEFVVYIIFGGTIGNLSDSLLGATLERKKLMGNNGVNFLSTLIGSLATLSLCFL